MSVGVGRTGAGVLVGGTDVSVGVGGSGVGVMVGGIDVGVGVLVEVGVLVGTEVFVGAGVEARPQPDRARAMIPSTRVFFIFMFPLLSLTRVRFSFATSALHLS